MLLSGALFALFMMGFWLYCLTDAVLTPASEFRGMPKPAWIAVITLTFIGGGVAWLIGRGPPRRSGAPPRARRQPPALHRRGRRLAHRQGAAAQSGRPARVRAAPRRSRQPLLSARTMDGRGRRGSTSSRRARKGLGHHGARRTR